MQHENYDNFYTANTTAVCRSSTELPTNIGPEKSVSFIITTYTAYLKLQTEA